MSGGLALALRYYGEVGLPAFRRALPDLLPRMAFGLAGEGSECFGFDDALSRDHDWGPAFCIWLEDEDWRAHGARVRAVYEALPGLDGAPPRQGGALSGGRIGCLCRQHWYSRYTGAPDGPRTLAEWRRAPEHFLATATNGAVFSDPLGRFTAVRSRLLDFYPEDLRLKKLAARAAVMAQAGQYNYPRCKKRGEAVAAQLALSEFMRAAMSMVYLLNRRYAPFYKWMHRGLRDLPVLPRVYGLLEALCGTDARAEELIERICLLCAAELRRQGLSGSHDPFMQAHATELTARIGDDALRHTHIMEE